MPPDRVFGRSEKIIRKTEKIVSPKKYNEIFSINSTVLENGKSWFIKDYKGLAKNMVKARLPFKITEQRIFIYRRGRKNVSLKNT